MGRPALDAGMHVVKAVVLLALLAPIAAACGGSDPSPDGDARRLPRTLDLDRVAGMRIPGSPRCKFEAETRTFLRGARGSAQDLLFSCGSAPQSGNVRTLSGAAGRTMSQEVRCRREEKGDRTVMCVVRHDRLLVAADVHCRSSDPDEYCIEDWPPIEAKARKAIARVTELL